MRLVSQMKIPVSGLRKESQRRPSAHSSATRMSASPFGMVGDQTCGPKRTWLNTEPPRLAMPCTSLCLTSKPLDWASVASTFDTMMTPWPPTPTISTFMGSRAFAADAVGRSCSPSALPLDAVARLIASPLLCAWQKPV